MGEFGEVISDDAKRALELLDEPVVAANCCQLFVDALAGTEGGETIKLRALVGNQVTLLLIDSGSTHTFSLEILLKEHTVSYHQQLHYQLR